MMVLGAVDPHTLLGHSNKNYIHRSTKFSASVPLLGRETSLQRPSVALCRPVGAVGEDGFCRDDNRDEFSEL
jgi:hypothetical protein